MDSVYPISWNTAELGAPSVNDIRIHEIDPTWHASTFHLFETFDPRPEDSGDRFRPHQSVWASGLLFFALLTCLLLAIRSRSRMVAQKQSETNQFFVQTLLATHRKELLERQRERETEFKRAMRAWLEINFRKIEFGLENFWMDAWRSNQATLDSVKQDTSRVEAEVRQDRKSVV